VQGFEDKKGCGFSWRAMHFQPYSNRRRRRWVPRFAPVFQTNQLTLEMKDPEPVPVDLMITLLVIVGLLVAVIYHIDWSRLI
jgi:hypothetical protein